MYTLAHELEQDVSMMKSYDKRTIVCTSCNATLNFKRSLDLKYEMIK